MNIVKFRNTRKVLNSKLVEIWAYRKYISEEEKKSDELTRKIQFIQKIESYAVFAEEEYTAYRRLYSAKHMEKLRKQRLIRRCRNLELRIKLDQEIMQIEKRLEKILKLIHKRFSEYCAWREQIIEFKGRHYDLYEFHCKYYEEVLINKYFNLNQTKFLFFAASYHRLYRATHISKSDEPPL